ncbi:MAG: NACHT domain-containing protein, partial [Waterburya sp.]
MTGAENLLPEIIESRIAGTILKIGWDEGKKLLTWVGKELDEKTKQLIFDVSRKYETKYRDRHGILNVLGMREPVS